MHVSGEGHTGFKRKTSVKVLSAVETKVPGYFDKIRDDAAPLEIELTLKSGHVR